MACVSELHDIRFPDPEQDPTAAFLATLALENRGTSALGQDLFRGLSLAPETPRVFGGQVFAQAVLAATSTVAPGRTIHSMHSYFLRPGDIRVPLDFEVDRLRDGGSISSRRVQACQFGKVIFTGIASFQDPEEGMEHWAPAPEAPDPESLPTAEELLGSIDHPAARIVARGRPFDIRSVSEPIYLEADAARPSRSMVWFRTHRRLPDDPAVHRAAIAYASDYTPIDPILRRHGRRWMDAGLAMASLDHTVWWHRPARADQWLLHVQDSPTASGARGLSNGQIFDRDGRLVASTAQEALVRES